MCDPFTLLAGVGGLASAGGALMGGMASRDQGRRRMRAAELSAGIERDNAALSLRQGAFEASQARASASAAADQAGAFFAAGGVDPTYGAPAFAQAWSAAQGEQDAAIAISRGATDSARHMQSAAGHIAQGADAKQAGDLAFSTSILQGVGAFARLAGQLPRQGVFSAPASTQARVALGDPWSARWGMTRGQPNFWSR